MRRNVLHNILADLLTAASSLSVEEKNVALAIAIFVGFIAMALLLPDFDGSTDEDWDMHGQDDLWKH